MNIVVILILNLTWAPFAWADFSPAVNEAFEITTTNARIEVVDCGRPGDQFRVYDNGMPLGETSLPGQGPSLRDDYDACLASGYHSTGSWLLGPGLHVISLERIAQAPGEVADDYYGAIRGEQIPVAPTLPVWAALAFFLGLIGAGGLVLGRLGA